MIFSTKSNRERHLTRKHGVNMLDPAARQTMDRPFKCHLCTFSSFATKGRLLGIFLIWEIIGNNKITLCKIDY